VRSSNGVGPEFYRVVRGFRVVVDEFYRVVRGFCGVVFPARAAKAMQAMMTMVKIDSEELKRTVARY